MTHKNSELEKEIKKLFNRIVPILNGNRIDVASIVLAMHLSQVLYQSGSTKEKRLHLYTLIEKEAIELSKKQIPISEIINL